jgi:hypothetical protein
VGEDTVDAVSEIRPRPPMTLGGAAAARVRLIVWCKPDPCEVARRCGLETPVPALECQPQHNFEAHPHEAAAVAFVSG